MNEFRFYDTSSLLLRVDNFEENEHFAYSSITLSELEKIKSAADIDADIKYAARKLLHYINEHFYNLDIIFYQTNLKKYLNNPDLPDNNDSKILACALYYDKEYHPDETIFVTNDMALKAIASQYFGQDCIESVNEEISDEYLGYKDILMNDDEMAEFYNHLNLNKYNLEIGEYLIVRDSEGNIQDRRCWDGSEYRILNYPTFSSCWFGDVKPMKGDIQQQFVMDSFINNKITLVKGPAGSGKSFLSLGYLLSQLDHGRIDKIIVFCNTVATKNAAKLGYLPGDRNDKLLDSQIGNLLASKLGGRIAVEQLIESEKLLLLPMSDIRGYDTSGMNAGIYISEAQNLDVSLMKLALQRIGEDCVCIIDGDQKTQVDDIAFAGANNGMRRVSKIFRGADFYGEVELKQTHRSKIAKLAELM